MNRTRKFLAGMVVAVVWVGAAAGGGMASAGGSRAAHQALVVRRSVALDAAAPLGPSSGPGVQPGGVVRTDVGLCTLNFLFRGSDGHRYIGTAGHCILGESPVPARKESGPKENEKRWAPGSGPGATDALGHRLGEFAYAVLKDPKDFALVRLDAGVKASPQVAFFGGPTGINSDRSDAPVVLEYYGNGVGLGATVPARSALALGLPSPDHVYAFGLAVPGDSGSAVISSDGRAVGVLVTVGIHGLALGEGGVDVGDVGITRLGPQLARAEQVLGLHLALETAPLN